ncbi:monovalent cation:proton antiporter-2 (CPA2) family protein [Leptospira yasudae]|uniref:Potassium transporter Kef n=1 Tax=Leptospira yasudae TaxID=2202201 RepID=A0A6N4QSJ0_9LEPT|nr:monovalent cation:proton antiporter-2 (CPA2) family protein [Leptospira yasudae]TGL76313.1 potassium transporter Kef [Leptospira yasudae]TGL82433.1 potassium transporter Kef [Leptospira yasudae]TGL84365.1 potassium transporter Kef [Leptospira yasudae]
MHPATPLITTIVAGLGFAFLFGALATRLRLPPLVGYLFAGIFIGPFTPGYIADLTIAPQLAELGVILLMFGVGLHFSLDDLLSVKSIAIPGAIVQIAIATLLGILLAMGFAWPLGEGFVFGLCLSTASTVVLLRAMQERNLLESYQGKVAVGWLIVEDMAMVIALVLLPPLAGLLGGKNPDLEIGSAATVSEIGITLAITIGKVFAFIAFMLGVGRRVIPWLLKRIVKTGNTELFRLSVLAIALGIAYGSSILFDVSFALGAFFAGMVLAESEFSHRAADETLPFRDAFAVLFFVSVGMLFNPDTLLREPLAVFGTFLIIVFGKSIVAFGIVLSFKHPIKTAFTISASLAQIGEFSFILAGLGRELHLLTEESHAIILAGAILSILVNPLLFTALGRINGNLTADPESA